MHTSEMDEGRESMWGGVRSCRLTPKYEREMGLE